MADNDFDPTDYDGDNKQPCTPPKRIPPVLNPWKRQFEKLPLFQSAEYQNWLRVANLEPLCEDQLESPRKKRMPNQWRGWR